MILKNFETDRHHLSVPIFSIFKHWISRISRYLKVFLKGVPGIHLDSVWNIFGNKQDVRGSVSGRLQKTFQTGPKNIGVHPQALISHLKQILNHKTQKSYTEVSNKFKTSPNFVSYDFPMFLEIHLERLESFFKPTMAAGREAQCEDAT